MIASSVVSRVLLLVFVLTALVSCPQKPKLEYELTTILPSPVTPGETVTAFGVFPNDAKISVAGVNVQTTVVSDGLMFSVPVDLSAGVLTVLVTGSDTQLQGVLEVVPRVDRALLEGSMVRISGVGWSRAGDLDASVSVNGLSMKVTRAGLDLMVSLPVGLPYGALDLLVTVNGAVSGATRVVREAGAVHGMVRLPAANLMAKEARQPVVARPALQTAMPTFTVFASNDYSLEQLKHLEFAGLVSRLKLPPLGASQWQFRSLDVAKTAFQTLQQLGLRLEWAVSVSVTDAVQAFEVNPPSSAGAGQWHLPLLGIGGDPSAIQGAGVIVAVVDTGVDESHPDLKNNLVPGFDFVDNDATPQDLVGHGTHVAGLVAAHGLALGVAPQARVLPVRVLRDFNANSDGPVAQGILWAAGLLDTPANPNPAQIINLSLGSNTESSLIDAAVQQALSKGVIVVAAAGNNGTNALAFPAALTGVISVTALAGPVSSYQPLYAQKGNGLWLSAFGGDLNADQDANGTPDGILSLNVNGGYALRSGTSMAAPQVSGMAALALASGTPAHLVRDALASTCTDIGARGYDVRFGYGLTSARVSTPYHPRTYILALDSKLRIVAWTLVSSDGTYTLNNLEPGVNLSILAASDADGDGMLAEAGELVSGLSTIFVPSAKVLELNALDLTASNGSKTYVLEAKQ
jgi:serine protease